MPLGLASIASSSILWHVIPLNEALPMKKSITYTVKTLLLLYGLFAMASAHALEVGDMAPDFTLPGTDGRTHQLSDYRDKQVVVIAWFPKAYTYGCTIECKSLADNGDKIRQYDVTYFMASVDPLRKNRSFATEMEADFPLLSDEDKTVAKAYNALSVLGVAKRHTFYIGKDGRILAIDKDITPKTSAEDMVEKLEQLGVAKRD